MATVFDIFEESDFAKYEPMVKWTIAGAVVTVVAIFMVLMNR